jgi:hypothetical protein
MSYAFYSFSFGSCLRSSFGSVTLRVSARTIVRKHCTRHTTLHHNILPPTRHTPRTAIALIHRKHNTASTATNSTRIHTEKTITNHNITLQTQPKTNRQINPSRLTNRNLLTHTPRRPTLHRHTTILPNHPEPATKQRPKHKQRDIHTLHNQLHHSAGNVCHPPMEKTKSKQNLKNHRNS